MTAYVMKMKTGLHEKYWYPEWDDRQRGAAQRILTNVLERLDEYWEQYMQKRNLKVLINDLERAIAEIKSEVYSDTSAYRIDKGNGVKSYAEINDEDGECD